MDLSYDSFFKTNLADHHDKPDAVLDKQTTTFPKQDQVQQVSGIACIRGPYVIGLQTLIGHKPSSKIDKSKNRRQKRVESSVVSTAESTLYGQSRKSTGERRFKVEVKKLLNGSSGAFTN